MRSCGLLACNCHARIAIKTAFLNLSTLIKQRLNLWPYVFIASQRRYHHEFIKSAIIRFFVIHTTCNWSANLRTLFILVTPSRPDSSWYKNPLFFNWSTASGCCGEYCTTTIEYKIKSPPFYGRDEKRLWYSLRYKSSHNRKKEEREKWSENFFHEFEYIDNWFFVKKIIIHLMEILINRPPKDYLDVTRAQIYLLIQSKMNQVEDLLSSFLQATWGTIKQDDSVETILKKTLNRIKKIYTSESERVKFRQVKNAFLWRFLTIFPELQFTTKYPRIDVVLKIIQIWITVESIKGWKYLDIWWMQFRYWRYHEIVWFCREKRQELHDLIIKAWNIKRGWKEFSEEFNKIRFSWPRWWVLPKNIESITKRTKKTFQEWLEYIYE